MRSSVPTFRKSSHSAGASECVEVADLPDGAAVRDTRNREAGHIEFGGTEWRALVEAVKRDAL
ncbi:DUF397 domain-containing protein [Actinorugispora endophytica]|uniref:Uncharacterized protein DUF397 n=1 Tax=Actinorugispora endophytica TaxID=1605990 RepID=A0A4R6V4H8_9ACTN|nr:DUF397 domain-containing protein [Actinorugispora endophytica]TDQ55315.1 uncharacterized protein DUF397 [Actinorugispora endophytica]